MDNDLGLNCNILNNRIRCNEEQGETDSIKITEPGMYEISLSGMTFQVSIG